MSRLRLASLIALLPMSVFAQTGPSFDCARAESAAETAICTTPSLAASDRRLAEIYGAALIAAGGLDAGANEAVATLKATQRGWIKGRDECWKAADLNGCIADAYARREGELVATWMLTEPTETRRFQCGQTPANEVSVFYFDLPTPAVRVEYGDGIDAMVLSPAASGTRYDGSFGRMFWEKGGEALFTWTDGAEQSCVGVD